MELHCSKTKCFVPIWNYIALKLYTLICDKAKGFVPIWNYIALKQRRLAR